MKVVMLAMACFELCATAVSAAPVRDVLKIEKGCYPIAYDHTKDEIGVVCRGQQNWTPDGAQLFNIFQSDRVYYNRKVKVESSLDKDLSNGIGPEPWLRYYFSVLDEKGIPRPK